MENLGRIKLGKRENFREKPQKSRHYSPQVMGGSPGELSEELVT